MQMRIILCGGGTAGHVTPAIAIAEEIRKSYPTSAILFIGREGGNENRAVQKSDIALRTISLSGLKRSLSPQNIKVISDALKAKRKAKEIIREFNPDIILGTGGYVCWPVIMAGHEFGIKTAIHESNVTPGLTTKILAPFCNLILLGHQESIKKLNSRGKKVVVGNPILQDFKKINRESARKKLGLKDDDLFILSFGGSIGAEKMNDVIIELIENYSSKESKIKHLHATGERYYNNTKYAKYKTEFLGCKILPYIENMPTHLCAADIVICRCGALTLSEISAAGVPSILIPSPNVSSNHQYKNAKKIYDKGAALLIEEKDLDFNRLKDTVNRLKNDKNGRKNKAKRILALSTPHAARDTANELKMLIYGI